MGGKGLKCYACNNSTAIEILAAKTEGHRWWKIRCPKCGAEFLISKYGVARFKINKPEVGHD